MPFTELDICNQALLRLGTEDLIQDLNENSKEARYCNAAYNPARQVVLEAHDWTFASKTVSLAVSTETPSEFNYQYALPSDCLKVQHIVPNPNLDPTQQGNSPSPAQIIGHYPNADIPFDVIEKDEMKFMTTDFPPPCVIRYTEDTSKTFLFSPTFADALIFKLASDLSQAIVGALAMQQSMFNGYQVALSKAEAVDANKSKRQNPVGNSILNSRR